MKSLREQKQDLVKHAILEEAERLFQLGGVDAVNIRPIAEAIGYSPANIYKYFSSKEEIIHVMLANRMKDIVSSIETIESEDLSVSDLLKKGFMAHIQHVLKYGEHYKTVMLSQDPVLLERTKMLDTNHMIQLPAQKKLIEHIKRGIRNQEFNDVDPVLTAQVMWSSMFGLLMRIITEKFEDMDYIEKIVNHYFMLIFEGITRK